jgi:2-polyprenyl-6-methoxyphenol hydroxylase-like FAD-dependent oxidoreductase
MMLGLLLARAGVEVVVLEKHADFLRDFRGDTIHPSTLEVIHELGLLETFLELPHQEIQELRGVVSGHEVTLADFRHLPTRCRFIALLPQWDFLDFLASEAGRYPTFRLLMDAEVTGLLSSEDRISGVRARTRDGLLEVRAALTVGADGRDSTVRTLSELAVRDLGAPMDVFWMRLSHREGDPSVPLGRIGGGRILVMIFRGSYWQCGYVIAKGASEAIRARGIEAFRREIAAAAPFLGDRIHELESWSDVKLLTVRVDRLARWWRPGLVCIGDAAHAMSPVGGVGINLAIQDAVALANVAAEPLRAGRLESRHLARLERRRALPTRLTQRAQILIQENVLRPSLSPRESSEAPPLLVRLLRVFPWLRRVPARFVGMGARPEHVRTPSIREG